MTRSYLLDTNVLLDYLDAERAGHQTAFSLIDEAYKRQVRLLVTPCSLKDVYYIINLAGKKKLKAKDRGPSEKESKALNEYTFSVVEMLTENMAVLSDAPNDPRMAVKLRGVHPDFEDNLLVAAAMNLPDCTLVTSDQRLINHSPVSTLSPNDALVLLQQ